jgi:hypothetical protein
MGETSVGRWDSGGGVRGSSLQEASLVTTLAAGWRWDRKGQVGVTAPIWLNHKAVGKDGAWGGGAGDLRVSATWDPFEERWSKPGIFGGPPVPVFTAGVRLPTGRDWEDAKGALFEDVTGLGTPALIAGVAMERTLGRTPWSLGAQTELGFRGGAAEPTLQVFGGMGRYLGTEWSVFTSLRYMRAWLDESSSRTTLGLKVTHGRRLRWRVWAGLEADLPIPYLGHSAMRRISAGTGVALVR